MQNARLDEAQAGIKIAGRNINNLRYADNTTLMAESEEELQSLLMKVKEESENVALKANIHCIIEKAREFLESTYFCFINYAKAPDCADHNKLWKILEEMGILDHLTCLLRNLYAGQEATVRTGHGKIDWFQIGKGVCQGCILSSSLFNLYAEYIMRNAGLEKHKLESRLPGEISITSGMQMTPPLWQKVKRN